jgi:hypothetical protein
LPEFLKISLRCTPAGDSDKHVAWFQPFSVLADDLAHLPPEAIAHDGTAEPLSCHETKAEFR